MAGSSGGLRGRGPGTTDLLGDPEAFLRELNRPSVTVETLEQHRNRVQAEADDVNVALKKNVYKNYALFIDSAKMISLLKNEMFTLSRLLSNQQALMSSLTEIAVSGDRTHGLTLNEKKEVTAKFRTNTGGNNMSDSAYSSKSSDSCPTPTRINPVMSRSATASCMSSSSAQDQMHQVIDRIEGCASILETRNRCLLNQGELTELDPDDYKKVPKQGKTLLVLLNDCLILAQAFPFPSRAGKKYKFTALFELDNIAVVNVKDAAGLRAAFKILMFPNTKVFDAESPESKKKWLDSFDSAKKNRRTSLSLQRRDSIMFSSMDSMALAQQQIGRDPQSHAGGQSKKLMSPVDRSVYSFDEELEDVSESESEMIPVWLQEFPDDMDVLIAQRNFEDAVSLVLKVNDHLILYPKCYEGFFQNDLRLRVNHKIQELVDRISHELQASGDRSLQHGPRAARRAVHLLLKLGKSPLATKLFLDQRSAILKFSTKQQLLTEASALPFVSKLCRCFVNNLIETSRDFENAFRTTASLLNLESAATPVSSQPTSLTDHRPDSLCTTVNGEIRSPVLSYPPSYPTACLVVWCQKEILNFMSTFSRNVFLPSVPLTTLSESVSVLRNETNRLRNLIGMDFLFYVDNLLKQEILKTIDESKKKALDELKAKFREEEWQSVNFKSLPALNRYWDDVRDQTLVKCLQPFVFDDFKLSLSVSTTFFAKLFHSMTCDFMKLSTPFTHTHIIQSLLQTFKLFMDHVAACARSESLRRESKFIRRNASFVLDQVCKLVDNVYLTKTGSKFRELESMRQDYEHLKQESMSESAVGDGAGSGKQSADPRKENQRSNSKSSFVTTTTTSSASSNNHHPHHNNSSSNSINNTANPEKKRSPSKSTISITEGKITSTITYL